MTSFERLHTAKAIKQIRGALLKGNMPQQMPPELLEDEQTISKAVTFGWCFLIATAIFIGGCIHSNTAHAQNCNNPNDLSPQMKKAYYELKKASDELGGFNVSIRC